MGFQEVLYIAYVHLSKTDGIAKKVMSQAMGFSKSVGKCSLLCCDDNKIVLLEIVNGKIENKEIMDKIQTSQFGSIDRIFAMRQLMKVANNLIVDDKKKIIYIRHMIPTFEQIRFLKKAKQFDQRVGYEIPTYPYYYEQFNVANNKFKALIKIFNDLMYWPIIYRYVDRLFVILCNNKAKIYNKMHTIPNGVTINRKYNLTKRSISDSFDFIGVGTIFPYHGYDRLISAIEECGGKLKNGLNIRFHVVGESEEISRLKKICEQKNLLNSVIFYGRKYGSDLDDIYNKCHIGVGTLALQKRNADIDTAIKNIEYFSHMLPVITSGKIFNIDIRSGLYYEIERKQKINIESVYKFYENYIESDFEDKINKILTQFDWSNIMDDITQRLIEKS